MQVDLFRGEFNELVRGIPAAAVSKTPQLVEIFSLRGKFDQFSDGVGVTVGGSFP
ncbi:MAG: hypothetical protein JWO49_1749 [Arthrobacter sp.]|nr:hypothetical protein [Arthrobacter sp.]